MNTFEGKKVENCFGGTHIYEYRLPVRTGDTFLERLGRLGKLDCRRNLPRPYFQALLPEGTTVKGVIDDQVIKVSFPSPDPAGGKQKFEELLRDLIARCLNDEER
ncbi:hypothetical protein HSX37_17865|uniref:Uncharacterized protein n=1 Tax=Dendrosporobacter quercicolus TaxID=146817 RepID=A0A1G9XBU9_9FIRM|nr:hypothetical protein [Dendrosporobacter quercicolus]NSL49886.1 hypothetical protein [Dendrosporobacter quercicolus DSM 1736]SDM94272.1 hypothetical protein SAMN04488502_10950 [Dendrosporobacter quercicolus]